MKQYRKKIILGIVIIVATLSVMSSVFLYKNVPEVNVTYTDFLEMVSSEEVVSIEWTEDDDTITFYDADGTKYVTENPKYEDFKKDMLENGIEVNEDNGIEKYGSALMIVAQLVIYSALFGILIKRTSGGLGRVHSGDVTSNIMFSDVAGLDELKEDLMAVVDFLKDPQKYTEAGAEIPKGILLYGPPGTGKTLLAKAVAGEAGVRFKALSGSDFDERYVGVGSDRMRKLFDDAKREAPCIIFIDEIDSLGGKRNSKQDNSDRQTLNTLLSEMDGFDGSNGVIVIAATNRIGDLDPALTRPGRFDKHFAVSLPETSKERRSIIDLYAKNKKLAEDVSLDSFSKVTMGSSPAMIKSVLNEAAMIAARQNNGVITKNILDEAWLKQITEGHLKKNSKRDDIKLIAWHEAGHALAGLLLGQDLTKVSVIPSTSGMGGATFITPKKLGLFTQAELEEKVIMLYAGRNAELLLTGSESEVTTGASNDIEQASEVIRQMIADYGMSETYGLLNLDIMEADPKDITNEAISIADRLDNLSRRLLSDNKKVLADIAEELIKRETLTGEEVKEIAERQIVKKTIWI